MLKNFEPSRFVEDIRYMVEFTDGWGNGYRFDCDEDGYPLYESMTQDDRDDYNYCMDNRDKFAVWNCVSEVDWSFTEPASGDCSRCGTTIELVNEYMGACQCPKCGQWYNLFGQELNDVSTWSEGDDW